MVEHEEDDENISILPEESYEKHLEKYPGKDTKSRIKNIILEIEEHSLMFTREEVVERAKEKRIPAAETNAIIDELIKEGYLYYVKGTEKLLSRSVWKDYSPAFEDFPEY
ncbi:TPA: hypothetical protein H1005_01095 [archaeon]|uniref:Uncharacterized protein n=1 Tax=Candidatus Naiadarchaeum limnaeum TaxID=2756139 RepID=A0A832XGD9_9ARCH|nr:hypothetical protein [Candidatus Naiadarchaeales archaeon SRR2090153.bin1042]HIK00069.1 hypothetical protein [Candidatus Naiadarchaeum limnaeum]